LEFDLHPTEAALDNKPEATAIWSASANQVLINCPRMASPSIAERCQKVAGGWGAQRRYPRIRFPKRTDPGGVAGRPLLAPLPGCNHPLRPTRGIAGA